MTPEEWRKKPENFERKLLEFNVHSEEDGSMYAIRITEQVTRKKKAGAGLLKVLIDRLWCVFCAFGDCFFQGIYAVGISVDLSLPGL